MIGTVVFKESGYIFICAMDESLEKSTAVLKKDDMVVDICGVIRVV